MTYSLFSFKASYTELYSDRMDKWQEQNEFFINVVALSKERATQYIEENYKSFYKFKYVLNSEEKITAICLDTVYK